MTGEIPWTLARRRPSSFRSAVGYPIAHHVREMKFSRSLERDAESVIGFRTTSYSISLILLRIQSSWRN